MCFPENSKPSKNCGTFEFLEFEARTLLMGLNGLRNKVAGDEDYPAADMNYLVNIFRLKLNNILIQHILALG